MENLVIRMLNDTGSAGNAFVGPGTWNSMLRLVVGENTTVGSYEENITDTESYGYIVQLEAAVCRRICLGAGMAPPHHENQGQGT